MTEHEATNGVVRNAAGISPAQEKVLSREEVHEEADQHIEEKNVALNALMGAFNQFAGDFEFDEEREKDSVTVDRVLQAQATPGTDDKLASAELLTLAANDLIHSEPYNAALKAYNAARAYKAALVATDEAEGYMDFVRAEIMERYGFTSRVMERNHRDGSRVWTPEKVALHEGDIDPKDPTFSRELRQAAQRVIDDLHPPKDGKIPTPYFLASEAFWDAKTHEARLKPLSHERKVGQDAHETAERNGALAPMLAPGNLATLNQQEALQMSLPVVKPQL